MFDIYVYNLKKDLERRISEHENTAENYIQDNEDYLMSGEYLAKAAALEEFLDWIIQQEQLPKNKTLTQ